MENFAYASPGSEKEAVGLLSNQWGETAVLAGGTDLISMMKDYLVTPKTVVNIKQIKALSGVGAGKGGFRIGATATFDDLSENAALRKAYPAIYEAALGVTSPQIRNMGTAGGDLAQRPRCWYFRRGYGLLGTKDGKSLIPDGENQYHAILNNKGPAYFVSPSSLGPALVALNATIHVLSPSGAREIKAEEFFLAPSSDTDRETALKANELLTEIVIPSGHTTNATYEVRQKEALDWPLATCSVALQMNGKQISSARVVLGHVAPAPYVATAAGQFLAGKSIDEATAEEAGKQALKGASPLSQNAYKVRLAQVAVKRALLAAAKQA